MYHHYRVIGFYIVLQVVRRFKECQKGALVVGLGLFILVGLFKGLSKACIEPSGAKALTDK